MLKVNVKKGFSDRFNLACRLYKIIFILNDIHVPNHEIRVLSYTLVAGDIATIKNIRGALEFLDISKPSLNNARSCLQRLGLIHKVNERVEVIPSLKFDFKQGINLNIDLCIESSS